jgi:hypothetical protein
MELRGPAAFHLVDIAVAGRAIRSHLVALADLSCVLAHLETRDAGGVAILALGLRSVLGMGILFMLEVAAGTGDLGVGGLLGLGFLLVTIGAN